MNKKNKVLLTSVGLALLSGIAATGSTFAWFTTTRTASLSYTSATVATSQSNLAIAYKSSHNTLTNSFDAGTNKLTLSGTNQVTDISGDGINFFKPTWSAVTGIATKIDTVDYSSAAGKADGKLVDFTVTISVSGGTEMNVYLGANSGIKPVTIDDTEDEKAVAASRMAVLNGSTPLFYYAPDADGEKHLTESSTEVRDVFAGDSGITDATVAGTALTTLSTFTTLNANPATPGPEHAFVASLNPAGTASIDVTFRVWLEGQDNDAISGAGGAVGGVFKIDLNFYALEV